MIVQCTDCHQDLRIDDDQILAEGTPVECPQCQAVFVTRPDGTTDPVEAPPTAASSGADEGDPDAGFQLPVSDTPDSAEAASPAASHTDASREDVPQGRPAQVSDDDDGDFDLISQLGITLTDEMTTDVGDLELTLDDEPPTPTAAAPEVAPLPAPPPPPAAPDPLPEDDLDFEFDDGSFSTDEFSTDSEPLMTQGISQEEGAFDLGAAETPAERERSLDDIFAEDESASDPPIETPALPDLPPLQEDGVAPGGEIDGSFGEAASAEAEPPPRPSSPPTSPAPRPVGPAASPKKTGSGVPGWLITVLLLLVVGGAMGAWVVSKGGKDPRTFIEVFVREIRSLVTDTGPPLPTLPSLAIDDPTGQRERTTDGEVFAIRGRVRNASSFPAYVISLDAEVLDGDGRVAGRSTSFAANTIAQEELAKLSIAQARAILGREIGEGGDNVRVQPGDSLPFLIIVSRLPAGDLSYGNIRATSRLPDSPLGEVTLPTEPVPGEPEAARLLKRLLVRLRALPEPEMRVTALAETLESLGAEAAVTLLSDLLEHAARRASRDPAPAAVLLEGRALAERLGYRCVQQLYKQAKLDGAENVCRLFVTHAPQEHQTEPAQPTDDPLATLGHRKARARTTHRRDEIQALLMDTDPDVIANVLTNPALTEQEVLKIASRRPTESATLERVFRHPRWSLRYRVRKALVYNPHTPVNVALALLPFLNAIDLKEVSRSPTAHDWIRERARELQPQRRARTPGAKD